MDRVKLNRMRRQPWTGYAVSVLLIMSAPLAWIAFHPPTLIPYIPYVPFIVAAAAVGGLGPGVLATIGCTIESWYFSTAPSGTFGVDHQQHYAGAAILAFTGIFTSVLFERLKRTTDRFQEAVQELTAIHAKVASILLVVDEKLQVEKVNDYAAAFARSAPSTMQGTRIGGAIGCLNSLEDPRGCGHGAACGNCLLRTTALHTLNTGTQHDGVEAWIPMSNGTDVERRCVLISTAPLQFGNAKKTLICAQDVTDQRVVEAELRRNSEALQQQVELINLCHDAVIRADGERIIRSWNKGAEEMYGWPEAQALGHAVHELLRTESLPSIAGIDDILYRSGRWDGECVHTRRDGRKIIVESRQVLVQSPFGAPAGILEINRDITERIESQEKLADTVLQLESAVTQKTVLLKEVHHRVKNNLAVIASLLGMQADSSKCAEACGALMASQKRVQSIALIHEHLYGNDRLDRINLSEYVRELVEELASSFGKEPSQIAIDIEPCGLELGIHRAIPCCLIINELVSNSFKYAFPGARTGRIGVICREVTPDLASVAVYDDGVGLPQDFEWRQTSSLGLQIVGILARQLGAEVAVDRSPGTRFEFTFPLDVNKRNGSAPPNARGDLRKEQ